MALNTSKLRWPELASDFKLNEMEIGTPSNAFSENSSVGLPRSSTVSATYSLKLLKIGSKHLPLGSMLQTKHYQSDGQLIYSGGWVIDDAALYETASTVLSMAGPTQVVGIECCFDYSTDADGDGFGDVVKRSVSGERAWRGARLDTGTVGELVEKGVLTDGGKQGNDPIVRKKPGRTSETDGEPYITHLALDAPVLHLVNAANASNEVKFKAGAELSKAVN